MGACVRSPQKQSSPPRYFQNIAIKSPDNQPVKVEPKTYKIEPLRKLSSNELKVEITKKLEPIIQEPSETILTYLLDQDRSPTQFKINIIGTWDTLEVIKSPQKQFKGVQESIRDKVNQQTVGDLSIGADMLPSTLNIDEVIRNVIRQQKKQIIFDVDKKLSFTSDTEHFESEVRDRLDKDPTL